MVHAVIFDMDGVLVDSCAAHFRSWRTLASEHGLEMTPTGFGATFGRTSREIVHHFWGEGLSEERIREIDARKERLYRESIGREFPAMDGAVELIDALHEQGMRLAVGSSGPPENVALTLERLGRRRLFDAVVDGMAVTRGKPDPQVFLLAAERLDVAPGDCVVIEDAPAGIEAAHRAGTHAVALLSTGRRAEDFRDVAPELTVRSLRELDFRRLRSVGA